MAQEPFDIYKGMIGRDFTFRGCNGGNGAMFEHICGWVVRIGPKALIERIAESIKAHDCEKDDI